MKKKELLRHSNRASILIVLASLLLGGRAWAVAEEAPPPRPEKARMDGAIADGLRWLEKNQIREGDQAGGWPGDYAPFRPAVASLAGLAFLANGHLPGDDGPYGQAVAQALKYVMGTMAPDGYMGQGAENGMYIHAVTSLFALSCLGMQADEKLEAELAEWCRKSLNVILEAQQVPKETQSRGGWRYTPRTTDSDVSISCWQMLVLHTAGQAGFKVPEKAINDAKIYLNSAFAKVAAEPGKDKGRPAGAYFYHDRGSGNRPSYSCTALTVFIMSLFDAAEEGRTQEALTYLRRNVPTWGGEQYGGFFYFSSFYMVQGMFQMGGEDWASFGPRMATLLLDHQAGDGSWPFPPDNSDVTLKTGPAYPVGMAVLILSLEKQFLPMYQRLSRIYDRGAVVAAAKPVAVEQADAAKEETDILVPENEESVEGMEETPQEDEEEASGAEENWGEYEEEAPVGRPIGAPIGGGR